MSPPRDAEPLRRQDDAALVHLAASGHGLAWETLVDRFGNLVWSVARAHGLDRPDARDVSQTTWMRLVEQIRNLRDPERVGGWLATTARHECLRTLRTSARVRPTADTDLPELQSTDPTGEDLVLLSERDAELRQAFSALGEDDRALLGTLVAEPALSYREIGAVLGMPVGSIGPKRARSLRRLRVNFERRFLGAPVSTGPDGALNH